VGGKTKIMWAGDQQGVEAEQFIPLTDIYELEDSLVVEVELPGLKRESIGVFVEGDHLVIEGTKADVPVADPVAKGQFSYLQIERKFGRYSRVIELPVACDTKSVSASYRGGVLIVEIKKIKDQRGGRTRIEVA
jgi:HSP20 family protein